MRSSGLRQRVLKHLGAIAIAAGLGLASPSARLLEVPVELVLEAIGEADVSGSWEDRRRLLRLLSSDPRVAVRMRVADESDLRDEALLAGLSTDESPRVRLAAARSLGRLLAAAAPRERVELVARWVTASSASQRATLAAALGARTPVPLIETALEVLCADEDGAVRRGAIRALAAHWDEAPEHYDRIALRLVDDPDERARRTARRVLSRHG